MIRATTAALYTEDGPQGVFDPAERSARTVLCTVQSVGMREVYEASAHGLRPEVKLRLTHAIDYQDEPYCELEGKQYEIIRTYYDERDGIELILQRRGDRR